MADQSSKNQNTDINAPLAGNISDLKTGVSGQTTSFELIFVDK